MGKPLIPRDLGHPVLGPAHVIAACAGYMGLTQEQLTGPLRTANIVWARHEATYCLRTLAQLSHGQIGAHLGGRDHTTAKNSLARVEERAREEPEYRQHLARLVAYVRGWTPAPRAEAALKLARRVQLNTDGTSDAHELAMRLLMAASLLADEALSDEEARRAALMIFNKEVGAI